MTGEFMPERLSDDEVEAYCQSIRWEEDTDPWVKIVAIGNIRRFAAWIRGEIPAREDSE